MTVLSTCCQSLDITTGADRRWKVILNDDSRSEVEAAEARGSKQMSTAAKSTLAATVAGTIGIIFFVHRQQRTDKAVRSHLLDDHSSIR